MNESVNSGSRARATRIAKTATHSGPPARRARKSLFGFVITFWKTPIPPKKTKKMQENASLFIWFCLDTFAMGYAKIAGYKTA
jgi:hypothetical protein